MILSKFWWINNIFLFFFFWNLFPLLFFSSKVLGHYLATSFSFSLLLSTYYDLKLSLDLHIILLLSGILLGLTEIKF